MLTNIPGSLPIPHPCSSLPKEKCKTYLVSKITHYELKLSISVFILQLGKRGPVETLAVFSDVWVWFLLFCGLPEFSSARLHGGDVILFQVIKSTCFYSEILNVVKSHLKK